MKILQVVPTISQEADGVADVVRNLSKTMFASGENIRIASLVWDTIKSRPDYLTTFPLGLGPRNLGCSPKMHRWLKAEAMLGEVDIIHNHGLWMMPNVYAGNACLRSKSILMVSPHGTMSSWAMGRNAIVKTVFWKFLQEPAIAKAACFHATSESEYKDIRRLGFKQPVCIIPCGVNMPPMSEGGRKKQLLFLSRIHPKKGVENLLLAWKQIEQKFPDWDLHIAGPDNGGYLLEMQALSEKLQLSRTVFRGPLFGDAKLQAYSEASLYVLPTHSENFGITVAEALAAGTPAIVTRGAPWEGLAEHGAGWWIEIGVAPLVACLELALAESPKRLQAMGQIGREWMNRDFSWHVISDKFTLTYQWLMRGGERPLWVRVD